MKKGISQLVMRHKELSLEECLKQAKSWGYEGFEALVYAEGDLSLKSSDEDLRRVHDMAREAGLELVSLCPSLPFDWGLTSGDAAVRAKGKEVVRTLIRCAGGLGIDAFLLVPGRVTEDVSYQAAYERAGEALQELAPEAVAAKVTIAVENVWNRFLLSPLEARKFIDEIGSPGVGWYFDIGNVVIFGYPEQWIETLGKRIKRVHAKDFKRQGYQWPPLMEGDVDWPKVVAALKRIAFNHYLISEVGGGDEQHPKTAQTLDKIIKMYDAA